MELAEKAHAHDAPAMIMGATGEGYKVDGRGLLWVDAKGEVLGPVSTESFKPPEKSTSPLDMCNEKQLAVATMTPLERSMHMWRKVGQLRKRDNKTMPSPPPPSRIAFIHENSEIITACHFFGVFYHTINSF